jgi:hypothetical protein
MYEVINAHGRVIAKTTDHHTALWIKDFMKTVEKKEAVIVYQA